MKRKNNNGIFYVVISLVAVLAIGGCVVRAYTSNSTEAPRVVNENGIVNIYEAERPTPPIIEEELSGMSGTTFTQTFMNWNGNIVANKSGKLMDASTTIVSFVNPFGASATSTVEMARLQITGAATSTATIACGASVTAYAAPTYELLSSGSIATSTQAYIENGIATAYNGNSIGVGGGAIQKITLTEDYPYFVCTATTLYEGAFTEATNTFDGTYTVRISQ